MTCETTSHTNHRVTDHFKRLSILHVLNWSFGRPATQDICYFSQFTQVQVLVLIIYQLDPVLTIILRLKSQLSNIYKSVVIKINYLDPVHANITQMEPRTDWSPDCHLTNCLSCDWSCQGCI